MGPLGNRTAELTCPQFRRFVSNVCRAGMTLLPWDLRPSHNSTTSTNNCWRTPPLKTDELLAVRNPDVLHLRRLTKKIAPLSVAHVGPRARLPLGPRSLHVPRRRQLHRPHAVARPEVPHL